MDWNDMNWNKVGAIGSLGSFVFAVLLFAAQVWPYPQWKAEHEQHGQVVNSQTIKAPSSTVAGAMKVPKSVVVFLIAAFLLSSFSIYGAWKKPVSKLVIRSANYAAIEGGGKIYDVTPFMRQIIGGDSLVLDIENHNFVIGKKNFVPHDPRNSNRSAFRSHILTTANRL